MSRSDPDQADFAPQDDNLVVDVETHPSDFVPDDVAGEDVDARSTEDPAGNEDVEPIAAQDDWRLWPPAPKVQILLIVLVFGVFNLILLGIWAAVMVYRFY